MKKNLLDIDQATSFQDLGDLEENFQSALSSFRNLLDFEICYISRFDEDKQIIEAVDHSASGASIPIEKGSIGNLEETYCKLAADKKLPKFVRNAQDEPLLANIPSIFNLSIRTLISVPITMQDGAVYGSICGFSRTIRDDISERDVKFVELLAEFASRFLESAIVKSSTLRRRRDLILKIIEDRSFYNVYQPIVNLKNGENIGMEGLSRFDDSLVVSPDLMFKEAKNFGLKSELEVAVLQDPIQRTHLMKGDSYISINVSPETVSTQAFKDLVSTAATDHLVVELNEADSVDSYFSLNSHLNVIRNLGVRLAIDDVGSGYANFRHILELSPEILKLDVSLIRDINLSRKKQALATAINAYCVEFGSHIIAEGVETEKELEVLKNIGINLIQGYYFFRPSPWGE